jgi:nucleoside-diphosphate-sugar epimerase
MIRLSEVAGFAIPSLAAKRILVTGASGFIGANLCARLSKDGAEVHAVSRAIQPLNSSSIRAWQADISDYEALHSIFAKAKPHIVFHLAGHVQGSRSLDHVVPALMGNLVTTVNLLTIATGIGCERIILAGSQEEPDPGESCATTFIPASPYAASKSAASAYARMFRALYQSPVTIARIYMTYGPGQRDLKKLIPYVILSLLRGQTPEMSTGARPLDWVYLDDVLDGLILIASASNVDGLTIPLGTGVTHTAREAAEKIVALMGSSLIPVFGALQDRQLEKRRVADVAATEAMIGWRPKVSFDEGLRRTIDWYREQWLKGAIRS